MYYYIILERIHSETVNSILERIHSETVNSILERIHSETVNSIKKMKKQLSTIRRYA